MHVLSHYHELLFQSMKLILFLGCHVVKNELLADLGLKSFPCYRFSYGPVGKTLFHHVSVMSRNIEAAKETLWLPVY